MAKEKTEFEIRANTLKAMAKQCTAKVKGGRAALMAVFIDRMSENAYASDGYTKGHGKIKALRYKCMVSS